MEQVGEEAPTSYEGEALEPDEAEAPSIVEATKGEAEAPRASKAEATEAEADTPEARALGKRAVSLVGSTMEVSRRRRRPNSLRRGSRGH